MANHTGRRRPVTKQWGVLAYIAGDNNLSDAGLEDIREMCEEGASDRVHVGVEIDTYGEHTGSIRYDITEPDWTGKSHRTVIERLPEKDTGDPRTLQSFLQWGLDRYKAKNYLVVVWNHGAGFRSRRRDIGYDDFGSSLDMQEIEQAFARAQIGPRRKIAVLGFDACLMNMLEIANHFRGQVEILVGSQETEPGDGWPYDKVLAAAKRAGDGKSFAKDIVRLYIQDYKERGVYDVTQSAVDVEKTEAAVKALSDLGARLAESIGTCRSQLKKIRVNAQTFEYADYVDLIHLAERIARSITDDPIHSAARAVAETTASCIIASGRVGAAVRNANGLSVWFPSGDKLYYDYRAKYLALKCSARYPGWVRFLDAYHA